ncbi:MAG TPA: hypothetical protein VN112_16365 [Ensifer sp.]|nr:hypothetical protein [Ensifer sp.]
MDRRSFIKGAVIAAATPAAAFAPAIVTTIAGLIAAYQEADKEHERLVKLSNEIFERGDRPEMGYVMRSEIGQRWQWEFTEKRIDFRHHLVKAFDKVNASDQMHHDQLGMYRTTLADRIAATNAEKQRVLGIFDARQKIYSDWEVASGLKAVDRETDRLDDIRFSLEDRIVRYPCETLDDVRTKIAYVSQEYGDDISGDHARHVLQNILGSAA